MAVMKGVFHYIKGKIGNMIYCTWHGEQVIKTAFIPANPQSESQTQHRTIFLFLIELGKLIFDDLIIIIWNPFRRLDTTGWSNFLKENLLVQTGTVIDYSKFILSKGSIFPLEILTSVYNTATGDCVITFSSTDINNQNLTDYVGAFFIESDTDKSYFNMDLTVQLKDGTITITCVTGFTAANCHSYIFLVNKAGSVVLEVSNSTYKICSAP